MTSLGSIPMLWALGWALLNSLWQGALLALLVAAALWLARRQSAELRYGIAAAGLGLMVLVFLGTLLWLSRGGDPLPFSGSLLVAPIGEGQRPAVWTPALSAMLVPLVPWLCLGWGLGFLVRLMLMGRALAWLYGPCLGGLEPPAAEWLTRFETLRRHQGIRTAVRLRVSRQVNSLMVLGWLKPVVLVPASVFLAIPEEALEALLLHELAHIRRGDFFANAVQTLAESLLFYHPAVWWLSRIIRQEREHCCDDAAARACGDSLLYASALFRLEELRTHSFLMPGLAPGANGGRLMLRIKRLLQPRSLAPTPSLASTLIPALLLVAALGAATLTARGTGTLTARGAASEGEGKPEAVEMDAKAIHVRHQPTPPPYPAEAKAAKIQGTVILAFTIGTDGRVTEVKALEGPPQLKAYAEEWGKGWEFEPAKVKGKPVTARFKLTTLIRLR